MSNETTKMLYAYTMTSFEASWLKMLSFLDIVIKQFYCPQAVPINYVSNQITSFQMVFLLWLQTFIFSKCQI